MDTTNSLAHTKWECKYHIVQIISGSYPHVGKDTAQILSIRISGDNVVYDVVDSYKSLMEKVMR